MKGATQKSKNYSSWRDGGARTTGNVKWKEKVVRSLAAGVCPQDLESSECVVLEAASISMFEKLQERGSPRRYYALCSRPLQYSK